MENKIKDIYNISFNIDNISNENKWPMHDWYNNLINKSYNQLNLFDVTRMIIQKVFLELAVSKSLEYLKQNPFCGQRYEGELMELVYKLDYVYLENYKDNLQKILSKALVKNKTYDWMCEEEREEFDELINSFQMKLQVN